ncbi:hypothetical protein O181_017744 [Austropuccinia psidii MF-1]|uniref:Protein-lysine N-methyltransferase EFM4 n=1 Tax=Austropuccinia psidii MF-1 TaxID=1389203 RepID=A0A9Q3GT30_9BASI|nr:hypothetical protein [Austropuccinia psidii MF-1]
MADGLALKCNSLPPSKLGTLAYWDESYEREIVNFVDMGDEGEVWFGEDTSDEILDWMARYLPPPLTPTQASFPSLSLQAEANQPPPQIIWKNYHILDVGCGNGQLLFLLAQGGYPLESLAGIDYSASSIKLASQIAHSKGLDGLRLQQKDILTDQIQRPAHATDNNKLGWDLIMDKGTFDAISLSESTIDGRRLFEHYPRKVMDLLVKPGGIFLVTSCNWTEEELIQQFVASGIGFKFHSKIPRPSFTFGGSQGSTVTTIAFEVA